MKIVFDIDGVLTDFNAYIDKYALPWFYKQYNLKVIYPNELEVEDILDIKHVILQEYNCDVKKAEEITNEMLNRYWISSRFIRFSLLSRFRPGSVDLIKKLKSLGCQIEIYTSRSHTCDTDIIGWFAKQLTICQVWLNGVYIKHSRIRFFKNDYEKTREIIKNRPWLVFEDKKEIIKKLHIHSIPVVCIAGRHNKEIKSIKGVEKVTKYDADQVEILLNKLIGEKNIHYSFRAAKAEVFWKKISLIAPLVKCYFRPYILNENIRIQTNEAVLYAPNHQSTLDPLVIESVVRENIHWAALQRFFQGTDSIFNNSKNAFLCKLTAYLFKKLDYFPIERIKDNSNANNFQSIKDMIGYLRIKEKVGIFSEGTTRRTAGCDFGKFNDSIIDLAQKTEAWIQPITLYWFLIKKKKRVIINFGQPFKVDSMSINEAMDKFLKTQQNCLNENKSLANNIRLYRNFD